MAAKLPKRKLYTVKDLMNDLKKLDATPSVLYNVGSELVYRELDWCRKTLGDDHLVTQNLVALMGFMQNDYETQLVTGELWRVKDTPKSAINAFMRDRPEEFLNHCIGILSAQIQEVLKNADESRRLEKKQYKKLEKRVRSEIKADKKNPNLWNKLRVLLWVLGKHNESSAAFKTAKDLGWSVESSTLVAI
ncbi:MAG: hypothetical protein ACXACG_05615 [Candidatus Thorarchaeota archaeon]